MSFNLKKIRGAGGGGGKDGGGSARAPVEAADSLHSIQYAKIIDLISEGEIVGLVDGLKSVYLNDTPIQNADGTYNFNNVTMEERTGTQAQSYMVGFQGAEAETIVGTEVTNAASVTRSITNVNNTDLRITLGFPQLMSQDTSTGDINGTSVEIAIDIQNNGGGFIPQTVRNVLSSNGFSLTSDGAITLLDSRYFNITVNWTGEALQTPQTCTFKLQYRLAASGNPWTDYLTHTFSGGSEVNSGIATVVKKITSKARGTKTFTVDLGVSDTYEFRVLKVSGSRQNLNVIAGIGYSQPPSSGAAYGGSVAITAGQLYTPSYTDVISGKTTSRYQRAYRFNLPSPGPWDFRVRRITPDNSSSVLQNRTFLDTYTEIIEDKLTYPNSAYIGLKIDARQFNSIPTRGYECYLMKIKVPSNYNPLTREYTGAWDGTFQTAWSDNPAWCFYDIVTNDRYGLGEYIDITQIDKWALYTIGQYCDETVQDGFGGIEPRFTCNLYLQTREQAFNVITNMASVFRSIAWWSSGTITIAQDAPSSVSQLFTAANVIGAFNYSGSSGRTRHNVVLVGWNDPQDGYRQRIEYVEDSASIARYGINQTEIVATGCTSRGQAHRFGRAIIYSEQNETETVTFRVGMDALYSSPGDIIQIADANRAGTRFGGRLIAASTTQVQLDSPITIEPLLVYTLSCVLPDGTVETVTVTNTASTTDLIDFTPAFSIAPQIMGIWVIANTALVPQSWRIVNIAEVNKVQLDITALAYRSEKYQVIENNMVLEPLPLSIIQAGQPSAPADLTFTESLYLSGLNVVATKGTVSWRVVPGATYLLTYTRAEQNSVTINGILTNSIDIQPMQEGEYTINVYAVNSLGLRSQAATITTTVQGKTTLPIAVENFTIFKVSGLAQAAWKAHPDLDVQVGGHIVIRHSPLTSGATWSDGVILDTFAGISVMGMLPLITGTYMAKAMDSGGRYSANMTAFVATEGMVTGFTTVGTITENPTFSGTKTDVIVSINTLKLGNVASPTIQPLIGTYEFANMLDLTTTATRRLEVDITAFSYDVGEFIDAKTDLIDTWANIDGNQVDDCDATIYAATTNDNPAGSPSTVTWSAWTPFFVSDFTCRALKFKIELESATISHNIYVSELVVHAKIPV